jgi:SPP1 family predicted phage head-tail adaptor
MAGAGDLREWVEIRRQSNIKNQTTGGLSRSWSMFTKVRAEVKSMDGREAVIGSVLLGVSHFQIRIRYRDDVRQSDQALWRGRELNIHSAEDRLGTRVWLWIHASTEAPQGA